MVIDSEKRVRYYEPVLLDSTEELLPDGEVKRTFYVEDPQENGNQMIILHFVRECNEVYINRGLLIAGELKLSLKPSCFFMNSLFDSSYCSKEQWFETTPPKLGIPSIPIIDPETAEEMVPELFYDENSDSVKARVKIKTYKSYFSFRISHVDGKVMNTLTNLDIGIYYLKGKCGFPKNLHKAVEFFEKDGSAEALYQIAHVFFDDVSVKDEETAFCYLKEASEAGNLKAKTELAIYYWKYDKDKQVIQELIQEVADAGFGPAQFLMGYLIETTEMDKKSLELSFEWYYKATLQWYTPAQFRLKYDSNSDKKKIFDFFCESVVNEKGIADFCIGICFLYGFGVHADVDFGLYFLNRSVVEGNVDAAYELLDYWEKNNNYQEVNKFCKLLIENPKVKLQEKFLNRLADGLNDIANEKGDRRYSEIALYVLNNV